MNKSNVRIRLTKTDYYKLVNEYNTKRLLGYEFEDVFGRTPLTDEQIIENSGCDIIYLESNNEFGLTDKTLEDTIYFGWDDIDWRDRVDMLFIKKYITHLDCWAITEINSGTKRVIEDCLNMECPMTKIIFAED